MSSNNRNVAIVVGAVVVLLAVVLLIPRGASPGGSGSGCGEAVPAGSPIPSPGCSTEPSVEPTGAIAPSDQPSGGTTKPSQAQVTMKVGLGYIPSVQFAPFYLADQAGYYRDAGLDVTFRHGTDYDVVALTAQGDLDVGLADGTS
ncbi:MAG: putative riboflavin transport system substrate-binding protein, partial [Chloroflexota bacterium]|nr:putative riboflavin transport system substrate-binding protein [Chloroflexota bacterium]